MNNLNPNLWGNPTWTALHYITFAYPDNPTDKEKYDMKQFFQSITNVLPCEKCRIHFAQNLTIHPLNDKVLSCRYNLINWLRDVHNEVNIMNNKKTWSYDELMDYYSKNQTNGNNNIEIITIFLLILIIIIIVVYMIKRNQL